MKSLNTLIRQLSGLEPLVGKDWQTRVKEVAQPINWRKCRLVSGEVAVEKNQRLALGEKHRLAGLKDFVSFWLCQDKIPQSIMAKVRRGEVTTILFEDVLFKYPSIEDELFVLCAYWNSEKKEWMWGTIAISRMRERDYVSLVWSKAA